MKKRILIIDDAKEIHESLNEALGFEGYEVSSAFHGLDALQTLARMDDKLLPDIILLDLMMPVMDGHKFLEEILVANNARYAHIPIVVMTAKADPVFNGTNRPIALLSKPMTIDRLFETVRCFIL